MKKKSVIKHFTTPGTADGVRRLAEALGVTTQAIYKWPDKVPELSAIEIDRLTDGAVRYNRRNYGKR